MTSILDTTNMVLLGIGFGPMEMAIVAVIGVLLFGKRLPEVGRSLGKGIIEFKKGVAGIESEIDDAVHTTPKTNYAAADDFEETTVPKFEPPSSEPKADVDESDTV